jgi:hypothetical protein
MPHIRNTAENVPLKNPYHTNLRVRFHHRFTQLACMLTNFEKLVMKAVQKEPKSSIGFEGMV